MADCPSLAGCPFFNDQMKDAPQMADVYKEKYCRKDNRTCARFMVSQALGKERVPADLFPHQITRAEELISRG